MTPGTRQLTSTPVRAVSLAADLVNAITPAFELEYADIDGLPSLPAIEAMLTTLPHPLSSIAGRQACVTWKTPSRLTATTRAKASGG